MKKTRALIVGGGFAGVKTALELSGNDLFEVTLISERSNFHYYPTLYHTATGGTVAGSAIPLKDIFGNKPVKVVQAKAEHLDRKKKILHTSDGNGHHYEVLVLALGSVPNYFGIKGIEDFAYSINTPEQARRFKNHLHEQLTAAHEPDLNYVIVGAGPTALNFRARCRTTSKKLWKRTVSGVVQYMLTLSKQPQNCCRACRILCPGP
jgi:NADH dehydrogenase